MPEVTGKNVSLGWGWDDGEDGWGEDMNRNLLLLDSLVQGAAKSRVTTAPPVSPQQADIYIIPAGATGAWAGQTNQVAIFETYGDAGWFFLTPHPGWRFFVLDEQIFIRWNGASWISESAGPIGGGIYGYTTVALLQADAAPPLGSVGAVFSDPDVSNNFPRVAWLRKSGSPNWLKGTDSLGPILTQIDALNAIVNPLADATNVLADKTLEIVKALKIGETVFEVVTTPYWLWAFRAQNSSVIFGKRYDNKYFSFGYEAGTLTPTMIAEVDARIADSGGSAVSLNPAYIDSGKLYTAEVAGPNLVMDLSPKVFLFNKADRDSKKIVAVTDRPYLSAVSPVAVSIELKTAILSDENGTILMCVPCIGQSLDVGSQGLVLADGLLTAPYPTKLLMATGLDIRCGLPSDQSSDPVLDPATITGFEGLKSKLGTIATYGVTMHEGWGRTILDKIGASMGDQLQPRILPIAIGRGGIGYAGLKKGTQTYANMIAAMTKFRTLALANGWRFVVPCIVVVHGEQDGASSTYYANLLEWQLDFETDLKAAPFNLPAGMTIPFVMNQPSAFSAGNHLSGLAMLKAHEDHPDKFTIACPNYWMAYADGEDCYAPDRTHGNAKGYMKIGDRYFWRAILQQAFGSGWSPLRPNRAGVTWNGTTLTVPYLSPNGIINLDTAVIPNPGNYGYKSTDGSGVLNIATANRSLGNTAMAFTFDRTAVGTIDLEYATTGYPGAKVIADQPRGCMRDSDPVPNWCVHHNILQAA